MKETWNSTINRIVKWARRTNEKRPALMCALLVCALFLLIALTLTCIRDGSIRADELKEIATPGDAVASDEVATEDVATDAVASKATADVADESAVATYVTEEHESKNGIVTIDGGAVDHELKATELANLMGNGINLGSSMECCNRGAGLKSEEFSVVSCETFWGQPASTSEMFKAMKDAGFDTIRIPVSWTNAMLGFNEGDYTIDESYLNRVEELINYGLSNDMYVIINDHWDSGWWGMFGSPTESVRKQAESLYVSMWTQIAERYAEYSDRLIFEGGNEEIGNRLNESINGTEGVLKTNELFEKAAYVNNLFVKTVRATGGNNAERFLIIPGYNADITMTTDERFKMPEDEAEGKLLISVHYYTPWAYCGESAMTEWGSATNLTEMNELLKSMSSFAEKGYGVVIGEYQVATDNGTFKKNTEDFYENLLDNCDLYGYAPLLWDEGELFNRRTLGWNNRDLKNIFTYRVRSRESNEEWGGGPAKRIETRLAAAGGTTTEVGDEDHIAWLMYINGDGDVTYSSDGTYVPENITKDVTATDAEITGSGTYTVGLDFTRIGGSKGLTFLAVGITNGEKAYPDYAIYVTEIKVNGSVIPFAATGYTTSDDGVVTRTNIYNSWVTYVPDKRRVPKGTIDGSNISAITVGRGAFDDVMTLEVTFEYGEAKWEGEVSVDDLLEEMRPGESE